MTKNLGTILVRFPRSLLAATKKIGLPYQELLRSAGIRDADLQDLDDRIPTRRYAALWKAILDVSDDPLLGIRLGLEFRIRDGGLVGYAMVHSRNLGSALQRLVRYQRILEDVLSIGLLSSDRHVTLVYEEIPELIGMGRPIEFDLAGIVACLREITGTEAFPERIDLPHAEPADSRQHRRLLGCELRFDQPRAGVVIRKEHLDLPIVASDEVLCGYLDESAERVLSTLGDVSFPDRVRRAIWGELSEGQPTLDRIATVLATSPRTLQRRLEDEGLTYAEVLRQLRHEMAVELLTRKDLAIYQVAFILGYSEPSAFFKAFRRWEGVTPRVFREAKQGDAAGSGESAGEA